MSDYISKEIELEPYAEAEADGFITPPHALEQKGRDSARPMTGCAYPNCETCDRYHGSYCTVPMVVTKQLWLLTDERLCYMAKKLTALEDMVYDSVLGKRDEP